MIKQFPVIALLLLVPALLFAEKASDAELNALKESLAAQNMSQVHEAAKALKTSLEGQLAAIETLNKELSSAKEEEKEAKKAAIATAIATRDADKEKLRACVARMDELNAAAGAEEEKVSTGDYKAFLLTVGDMGLEDMSADAAIGWVANTMEKAKNYVSEHGTDWIVMAAKFLGILFIFKILSGIAASFAKRAVSSGRLNASELLKEFFISITRKVVMLTGLMIAVSTIGVDIGPILAGVGVFGFVIGFAMQETLSNFAAGVMILLYRPYDIGDAITAGGVTGKVDSMSLVATNILTPDNQQMVVPNSKIWGDVIINITARDTRRVDLVIGIGYGDDLDQAKQELTAIIAAHDLVLNDPAPVIEVSNLGDSAVELIARPWCKTSDYWKVNWDLTRSIKLRFDECGLNFPYPQQEVHLIQADKD